jgi:Fe-coproporphyrin III synthase
VAFSGGEPLIYPGLQQALRRAKALGLKTSVTTNGTLLDPPRLEALRDLIGLLAVSLDGPPALHNEIRGSSSAFDRLITGIESLRSTGMKFGFIHTLTRTSGSTWSGSPTSPTTTAPAFFRFILSNCSAARSRRCRRRR